MLVRAVLRPEQREDGELEVVRLAAQQLSDSVELPVGETEGAVERLFRYRRQVLQSSPAPGWGRSPRIDHLREGAPSLLPAASLASKFALVSDVFAPDLRRRSS